MIKRFVVGLLFAFVCGCNGCEGCILDNNNLALHGHLSGVVVHCDSFYDVIEFEQLTESTVYVKCTKKQQDKK